MISKVLARFAALFAFVLLVAGCKSDPPKPGQTEFEAANSKIATFDSEVGFGNTPAATAWAKKTAVQLKKDAAESFSGGKDDDKDAITKGNFLVYCQAQGNDIVFLVQAPNLDGYEGDVRKSLYELAWEAAQQTIGKQPGKNLVVALRGKLLYGALGSGKASGPAPAPRLETALDVDALYPHFVAGGVAAPAGSGAPAASAQASAAPAPIASSAAPRASAAPSAK
jgi:hypothetical protein